MAELISTTEEQATAARLKALHLLGELLVQIRGIAGDASDLGHVSSLGRGRFSPAEACKAIYALADAAHNLPEALAEPRDKGFWLSSSVEEIMAAGAEVFGDHTRLMI